MLVFFLAVPKTFTLECVQGSEVRASRVYETSNFHSVELDGSFDLVITQGPTHKVWARGDEKILEHLDFSVESGFLTASLGPGSFFMYDMVVFVETPHLRRAMISGSGDIALGGFQSQLGSRFRIGGDDGHGQPERCPAANLPVGYRTRRGAGL